ncbi:hypothetical protein [Trichloromonas sp.]|uniref:hypothetical protein n=1 Tax=Trichloromonas sp. TaxID=3069249 RepID=UPI002A3A01D6|nr:hypothetical protein [Trichloromonas sp.]
MSDIRYYITGHGLGHASRSCQIINTLRRRHPEISVEVVSTAASWFFRRFLDKSVPVRPLALDFGVLQQDSLVMREEETLRAYRAFLPQRQRLTVREAASLRKEKVKLVAAAFAAAAAAAADVYSVGVSNFTWDWIYAGLAERHSGYDDVLQSLEQDYRKAELLLRLPFHTRESVIRVVEDQPLVARVSPHEKKERRKALGLPAECRVGLISFGGFGLKDFDPSPLRKLEDWIFLSETRPDGAPANVRPLPPGDYAYPDLVRAADVVVTKPGYGIVSECLVNGTACLYTGRGDFREQALLIEGLRRYGRAREIGNDDLRRGNWGAALADLLAQPEAAEELASGGDVVIADKLARLVREQGGGKG